MPKKWNIEKVKQLFEKENLTILDEKYKNNTTKLNYKDKDGYLYVITLADYLDGKHGRKFTKINPHTIDNIKHWLKVNNIDYELLSTVYISNGSLNRNDKLEFRCPKGHIFSITWNDFYSNNYRCNKCHKHSKTNQEFINEMKEKYGNEYTVLGEYQNNKTSILIRHNLCGTEWYVKPANILYGYGCPNNDCCHAKGDKHYRWNKNLSEEERENNKSRTTTIEYRKWKVEVFKRYDRKCAICGKKHTDNCKLIPHHINSWDKYPDERYLVENGIALCEYHHKLFHSKYGYGSNDKEQFNEFLSNF